MKNINLSVVYCLLSFALFSCGNNSSNQQTDNSSVADLNESFDRYKETFMDDLWKLYPGWASSMGYHKYDSMLTISDEAYRQKEIDFANKNLDSLKKFAVGQVMNLSDLNKIDFHILKNALNGILFNVNEFRDYEWNPASYNVGGVFAEILQSKHASNEDKLRTLYLRMANIPTYYAAAKKTIKNPTIEHTGLGIQQNKGSVDVFKGMMMDSLKKANMDAKEHQMIETRINESVKAIEDYVSWLKQRSSKLVIADPTVKYSSSADIAGSFRIGKDLYEKKFLYDIQSRYTAEEMYKKALQRKDEIQKEMVNIAGKIYGKYFPDNHTKDITLAEVKILIDEVSKNHVHRDSFQTAIEKQIPELTKFVNDKNLLYMDPDKPLVVRKEPAYMAGIAGVSVSSPGPYDKEGNTYYNVGSLAGYSAEGAESYLREYNQYILQILNIHEAIPGHYAQLVYSNQSPSIVKSVFGNGAMVEGWAVYTERMMLENGYGNNDPEMWLMYYKWHLRSVCNTILDYSVHVLNMSKEDAVKFLVDDAFQQKQEAENKWKRVTLTQVQLDSYFTGFTEIYELREELKKKSGNKFNLKEFHEKFLSYGSAPVKYIRELMLH